MSQYSSAWTDVDPSFFYFTHLPCTCPPIWHGVVPPSCPAHNPPQPTVTWRTTNGTVPVLYEPARPTQRRRHKRKAR